MKDSTKDELVNFKERGYAVGGFIQAVLENNLIDAIYRADEENARDLREILRWVNDELPWSSWGGPERVRKWQSLGGLNGMKQGANLLTPSYAKETA